MRKRNQREIETTLGTGMPSVETAVGQKAKEVSEAQAQKLATPPPVHGSARWDSREDAAALTDPLHFAKALKGTRGL